MTYLLVTKMKEIPDSELTKSCTSDLSCNTNSEFSNLPGPYEPSPTLTNIMD